MPAEVFYSYSHRDEGLRAELEKHLSTLRRNKVISEWHDRKIVAGTDWSQSIDHHINTSDVILLLISPDFMASDYCYEIEMRRAINRHHAGEARVIPVILRAVDCKGALFENLQAVPTDGKPVTSWQNADEAFKNVADGIRKVVESLDQTRQITANSRNIQANERQFRLLEGAAPTRMPVRHSRFVVGKVSIEGSQGLRADLDRDDTYSIKSANVRTERFPVAFAKFKGEAIPVTARVRLIGHDFEPQHQEVEVTLNPESDTILLPFQVRAVQRGPKILTLEVLIENQFVIARGVRTVAEDRDPPGPTTNGSNGGDPPSWTVIAVLAIPVLAELERTVGT